MVHKNSNCRALIQNLLEGQNWQEDIVKATAEEETIVQCLIKNECLNSPDFKIKSINVVKNTFLEALYLLKKAEVKSKLNKEPQERPLIHCTSEANAEIIAKDNFDWRKVERAKFGIGISFSNDAKYADQYANYNIGKDRAFIISKVLVTNSVVGEEEQDLPKEGYDTTTSQNGNVVVKYSDNEVLPIYIVYYTSMKAKPKKFNNAIANKKARNNKNPPQNRYRRQGSSRHAYSKGRTNYNPRTPRVPQRDIIHVRRNQPEETVIPLGNQIEQFTFEEPVSRRSKTRSFLLSLFRWTMFTIVSVTISLLLFQLTNKMH